MVSLFAPHLLPLVPWDDCVFVIVVFTAFLHFKFYICIANILSDSSITQINCEIASQFSLQN